MRTLAIILVILLTIFLSSYNISLAFVKKSRNSLTPAEAFTWATRAYVLAPGAYYTFFNYTSLFLIITERPDLIAGQVESLREKYPYVPGVLFLNGVLSFAREDNETAKMFLEHAIDNDPSYEQAIGVLRIVEGK